MMRTLSMSLQPKKNWDALCSFDTGSTHLPPYSEPLHTYNKYFNFCESHSVTAPS